MTVLFAIIGVLLVGLCGAIAWKIFTSPGGTDRSEEIERLAGEKLELERMATQLKVNLEQRSEEVGELKQKLDAEKADNQERQGKGKQLFAQYTEMKTELEHVKKDREQLQKSLAKFEEAAERREKEFEKQVQQIAHVEKALQQEKERVIREDEEKRRLLEEQRDRVWAEHEISVIALMADLCKQPSFAFTAFTNTVLPEGFDGSLKPDFMIEFLGQYVIFDAKVSKAKSMKAYIDDQVKKTVAKVKDNALIYPWIFLVVPANALGELKQHHYAVEGYHLFVVSPEALPVILSSLKRITAYEFAEQMDPQKRENIVQLVAELDFHVNLRNAVDLVLTKMGTDLLDKAQRVDPDLAEEVMLKKQPMNAKASVSTAEIKKIVAKLTVQQDEIHRLVSPKAAIGKTDMDQAANVLAETLF